MLSYYQRTRTMFRLLPGDAIRRYILDSPTGETFLEMVALKMLAQDEAAGKMPMAGENGSVHQALPPN